jgi:hypothetical protein
MDTEFRDEILERVVGEDFPGGSSAGEGYCGIQTVYVAIEGEVESEGLREAVNVVVWDEAYYYVGAV